MKLICWCLWGCLIGSASALELREDERVIEVLGADQKLLLRYHKAERPVPDGVSNDYRRSGYIHPVMTTDGRELTGDFAADHLHQHGMFFAWTSGKYDGRKIDFWNQKKVEGRVAHRRVLGKSIRDGKAWFAVELSHFDQREGGVEILRELWMVTVHEPEGDHYWFDLESRQRLVGEKPLLIEKYHYGGMALRGNAVWLGKGDVCNFLTSAGKTRADSNHTRPDWVAMWGELGGKPASLVAMGHKNNFRAPQPVRVHPDKPYFCFAPMVNGAFSIEKGKGFVSRYRFVASGRRASLDWIDPLWKAYSAE
ncbi:MAG: hypothetical protein ACI9UA_005992 [Pseudoalteromonas tetraodonis]|jgi:hypothetical protein